MVLLSFLLIFGAAVVGLYRVLRRVAGHRRFWVIALSLGLAIGVTRASLACFGWYVVEHTGGPAQVPAFALAMLSWPEAAFLPRRPPGITTTSMYVQVYVLLVVSSLVVVTAIAAVARMRRSPQPSADRGASGI